jgi:hypothetical protein
MKSIIYIFVIYLMKVSVVGLMNAELEENVEGSGCGQFQ